MQKHIQIFKYFESLIGVGGAKELFSARHNHDYVKHDYLKNKL